MRCSALTLKNKQCLNNAFIGDFCRIHSKKLGHSKKYVKKATSFLVTPPSINIFLQPKFPFLYQIGDQFVGLNTSLFIDNICGKTIKNAVKEAVTETKKQELKNKISSASTCECCFENGIQTNQLIRCSCESPHFVCIDCITRHVESKIEAGASLKCMFNCLGVYDKKILKMVLSDELNTKFLKAINRQEVSEFAKSIDNYQICPFCSEYGCVIEGHIPSVCCGICSKLWCSKCRRTSHQGDCYVLPKNTEEETIKIIDRILEEISTEALTHSCPSCKVKFFKEEGCNHMTCPKCGTGSCFICGIKVEIKYFGTNRVPSGYWHFKGHAFSSRYATCVLYNNFEGADRGNIGYNNTRLEQELEKFILQNTEKSREIIYKRLVHLKQSKDFLKTVSRKYKINTGDDMCRIF